MEYKNVVRRIEKILFGDFDRIVFTAIVLVILGLVFPMVGFILLVSWLVYLEYRIWKAKH